MFLTQSLTFLPGSNFLGQPILNLNENFTDAAIKLLRTLFESPTHVIFILEIGFVVLNGEKVVVKIVVKRSKMKIIVVIKVSGVLKKFFNVFF